MWVAKFLLSVLSQRHIEIIFNVKEQTLVSNCLRDYSLAKMLGTEIYPKKIKEKKTRFIIRIQGIS